MVLPFWDKICKNDLQIQKTWLMHYPVHVEHRISAADGKKINDNKGLASNIRT